MAFTGRYSIRWIFILAVVTQCKYPASGQVYPYVNYSVRQGLVNSNVYSITQDPAGFIWLGTENGLSRFDGVTFQNYTLEQLGLKSYISSLITTNNGNILFCSGSSGIFSFDPITEKLICLTRSPVLRSNQLIIKDDMLVSLHENRGFDFISLKSGEILFNDSVFIKNTSLKALSMIKLKNDDILLGRKDGLYQLSGEKQIKMKISGLNDSPVYSICEDTNSILVGGNGVIYRIEKNKVIDAIHVFNNDKNMIRNIKIDNRGNLWFNIWGLNDLYMISENTLVNVTEKAGINNGTVTCILMEPSGTIWTTSLGKGIFQFNNNHFLVFPESDNLVNANIQKIVKTPKGGLLLGTDNGLAYLDPKGKMINNFKHKPEIKQYIRAIVSASGNQYLVATIDATLANSFSKLYECPYENIDIRYTHSSTIWADSSSAFIGNWDNRMIEYHLNDFQFMGSTDNIFSSTNNTLRINCLVKDAYGRFWFGSQMGLCIINQNGEKFYPRGSFQKEEVYGINDLRNGTMFIVTNSGFYFLSNNPDEKLVTTLQQNAIQGTNCVAITGENEYLAGTSYGLFFIKDGVKSLMTIQDGLLAENINDIYYDNESSFAWVGTSEGLMKVDMTTLRNGTASHLDIRQVLIVQNGKNILPGKANSFDYNSSAFSIKYQAFHYHNPQQIRYHYRVDDGKWIQAPSNEIQFASMPVGDHKIALRTSLDQSYWGPVRMVNITVLPPFYRTWWFYILEFITGSLLVGSIVTWQIRVFKNKQREKGKIQQKMVELQQKALASNLNPHFVFNSLNAIQHFINSRSPAEANDYLAKFARLMRMHLNMAEKSSILLHEEISRLEFYLGLEQMRFGDRMKWSVKLDPSIDPYHTEIPNMIIQPFVENAIWHGIMPSPDPGFISLEFIRANHGSMQIIITDNGIGFGNPASQNKNGHESKGTRLIRERLLLLDPHAGDLLTFTQLEKGTRVTILLTKNMFRISSFELSVT